MPRRRPKLRLTIASLLAMIATCAGCWQKIEYKGHPSPAATSPSAQAKQPPANDPRNDSIASATPNPATVQPASGGASAPSEPTTPPLSSVPTASPPKSDDDRYAAAPSPDGSNSLVTPSQATTTDAPPPINSTTATPSPTAPDPNDRYSASATSANPTPSPMTAPTTSDAASTPAATANDSATASTPVATAAPTTPEIRPAPPASTSTQPSSKEPNSRSAAWILGSRLALAALANDRQLAAKNVPVWFADAQAAAKSLDVSVPNLPQPGPADESSGASKQVMDFLLINGQRIGHDITKRTGPVESSLFEFALKSNILLVIYRPGTPTVDSVSAALQEAAVRARLPEKLWQPLILAINTQAPPKEVQAGIKKLHADVEQYLAGGAAPNGR